MSTAKRIVRNFASLAFADFFNKALAIIAVAYLARILKADGFGKIEFAQAIVVYFMLAANLGLATFGAREIAKERNSIRTHANHILGIRMSLSMLSYALLVIFTLLTQQSPEMRSLLLIYGLTIFTFSLTLDWVFQGIEKMEFVALASMASQLAYVGGLFVVLRDSGQLLRVPGLRVAAAMIGVALLLHLFLRRYGGIRLRIDLDVWKRILRQSAPMGLSFILIKVYYTFDTVMLGFMKGQTAVGYYNAAYKVVLFCIGFAALFGASIFPALARSYKESSVQLRRLILQSSRLTVSFGLPMAVGGTILSREVIQFIYGPAYLPAVLPLQLLIWSVFTVYFNCPFAYGLLACERQREYLYSVSAGAVANLTLNFVLIPRYGMLGAGIATITCEVIVLALILFYSRRVVIAFATGHLAKALSASAVMGAALCLIRGGLASKLLMGIMIYAAAMTLLRGVTAEDVGLLKQLWASATAKRGNLQE